MNTSILGSCSVWLHRSDKDPRVISNVDVVCTSPNVKPQTYMKLKTAAELKWSLGSLARHTPQSKRKEGSGDSMYGELFCDKILLRPIRFSYFSHDLTS